MTDNAYKPYTAKRWTEIIQPIPTGKKVEYTEEQKEQYRRDLERLMKESGALKPNESLLDNAGGSISEE